MQRIYLPNMKFPDVLEISEKQLYHQLTRVLRGRLGQEVVFFNGEKLEDHLYSMIHIDKNSVSFKRKEIVVKAAELVTELCLYQASPNKLSKFETIVQKCCEVGYRKIIFFESERSQKLVLSNNKKERLHKIAIEAIEQCGGNIIPEIEYDESINNIGGVTLVCHTQCAKSTNLRDVASVGDINVVVGPEGGLSDDELQVLQKTGAQRIFFGDRILRCETVGEVVGFYISQKK